MTKPNLSILAVLVLSACTSSPTTTRGRLIVSAELLYPSTGDVVEASDKVPVVNITEEMKTHLSEIDLVRQLHGNIVYSASQPIRIGASCESGTALPPFAAKRTGKQAQAIFVRIPDDWAGNSECRIHLYDSEGTEIAVGGVFAVRAKDKGAS